MITGAKYIIPTTTALDIHAIAGMTGEKWIYETGERCICETRIEFNSLLPDAQDTTAKTSRVGGYTQSNQEAEAISQDDAERENQTSTQAKKKAR